MFLEYSLLILSLPCWCLVSRTYAIPVSSPLYEDKVYSLNKLTYSPNEALPENEDENFGEEMPPKSRISDFTDSTGFNPFLDLSEGPTSKIRSRLLNSTLIPGDNYYKYEGGGKERHSKRDNNGHYGQMKKPTPAWLLEGEKPRGQRLPVEIGSVPSRTGFARGFGSIVEGESSGRDSRNRFWMGTKLAKPISTTTTRASTTTTSSPSPSGITPEEEVTTKTIPEDKNDKKGNADTPNGIKDQDHGVNGNEDDYVTMKVPDRLKDDDGKVKKTKNVKKEMEGIVEIISKVHGGQDDSDNETNENIFIEDGSEKESTDEETNDNVNSIATFLETKSFVYSLALICASVVFFAAVLTGMFVYRKKRRRLPGVHKKGGRFYFATPKNRRGKKDNREKEERILDDDFRVTVC